MRKQRPILAVTMGDPGGIGPEVVAKGLHEAGLRGSCYVLVIGSRFVFDNACERCHVPLTRINPVPTLEPSLLREDSINLLDVSDEANLLYENLTKRKPAGEDVFEIGKISLLNATLAFTALKIAAFQAACGLIQAVVTAPLHKEAIRLVHPGFTGHTDYLAKVAHVNEYAMFFYSDFFCVTLVTVHLPLREVASALSRKEITVKIKLTHRFLKTFLRIEKPKIAVACLNPHGREFGNEEERMIEPAVQEARRLGIDVRGPLPGDQVFHEAYHKRVHAVVAMYHDQGLAPFKMIAFDKGVNVTIGLPYLRTSPDHGTAFDIAYQGKANPSSFIESFALARRLLGIEAQV